MTRSQAGKRYARIVHAIADILEIRYTEARAFYKPVVAWLEAEEETLSRAAVERYPRVVVKIATGLRQVAQAETELHRIQQTKAVTPAAPVTGTDVEEWEVTVKYTKGRGKHHGEVVDVTLRLMGQPGQRFTNAQVRAAAWYALRHGTGSLKEFDVAAVDWRNTRRSGKGEDYAYTGGQMDEVLENARGIFYTVGMGGLRVALVE